MRRRPATLDATDVDSAATFVVQSGVAKTYGTFSIEPAGAWTYTLDDGNAEVQALNTGGTLHELVTVATADGTTQVIDITIHGANDAAVITGTATGSVTEKSGVANGTPGDGDGDRRPRRDRRRQLGDLRGAERRRPRPTARSRSMRRGRGATRSMTATRRSRRSIPAARCTSW